MIKAKELSLEDLLGRRLNDVEQRYAPGLLYASGSLEVPLPSPRVSVVGTREASEPGKERARFIVKELVKGDIITVSGLARGIDTAVHEATLEFGGKTVAVLGTPLDRFYPPENAELQKRLMSEQMVISQFPVGHKTSPKDFVIRNRTMALISDATIIVEAKEGSGIISQGWEDIRLGRPLYISEPLVEAGLSWVKSMQWYGARVLRDVDQVIEEISFPMERPL